MKTYYCNVRPLLDGKLFWQVMEYVDDDRRIKIERLKHPLDKARSLGCFLLYRYLWIQDIKTGKVTEQNGEPLCESLTLPGIIMRDNREKAVPHMNIGKNGKPDLANRYKVHISFSHSGDMAAVAYHVGEGPVGVDIQVMSIRKVKDHVAEFMMSGREFEYYNSDQCSDKCNFFYEVFCCKEAYTKMTGEGISADFRMLSVAELRQKYQLYNSAIEQDGKKYMLAVCWNAGCITYECKW